MARTEVTKKAVAGFVEQVLDAGTDRTIDMKVTYGESFEPYMRENVWMNLLDLKYADQERVIEKLNYTAILENNADFDPTKKQTGVTVKPEIVRIPMDDTQEWAVAIYEKDYELSNFESTGQKIIASLYRAPENYLDKKILTFVAEQSAANTLISEKEFSIDGLEITAANGELFYNAILAQLQDFIETGATNDYVEGSKIPRDQISIAISDRASELLVASKRVFVDQSGILNAGGFGSMFRNVNIEVVPEIAEGYNAIIMTKRAIAGSTYPRHTKFIGAEVNQTSYQTEVNTVVDFGANVVFENEVTAVVETAVVVPAPKPDTTK